MRDMNNDAINPSINNRKTQTFNLIIGISTLLIAILGATFAYFTATARSSEGEVTVKSAMVSINFSRGTSIKASNLIPASEKVALSKFQKSAQPFIPTDDEDYIPDFDEFLEGVDHSDLAKYLDRRCVDANGREVCYVFWFSVTSDGKVGETTDIMASIRIDKNEFENLSYLVYEVEYEKDENDKVINDKYGLGVVKSYKLASAFEEDPDATIQEDIPFAKFGSLENDFEGENLSGVVTPIACLFGESDDASTKPKDDVSRCKPYTLRNTVEHNFQIVIWLEETGFEQDEQGKSFEGTVAVEVNSDAGSGSSSTGRITGQE